MQAFKADKKEWEIQNMKKGLLNVFRSPTDGIRNLGGISGIEPVRNRQTLEKVVRNERDSGCQGNQVGRNEQVQL